jgi:DNA repair exonuclease SbcCD ATPase subunit
MAINDLKIYGNDESTQSYSEFFKLLRQYNLDINATVEDLNKLNIENVKSLGMLQKRQQEELAKKYTDLRKKANEKEHADQLAKLKERYVELERLDEAALKARTGLTKKQLADEKAQEQKKLDAIKKYKDKQAEKAVQQKIKEEKKQAASERQKAAQELAKQLKDAKTLQDKVGTIKGMAKQISTEEFVGEDGQKHTRAASISEKISGAIGAAANAMGTYAYGLKATIEEIASYRGKIDTRLQGLTSGSA